MQSQFHTLRNDKPLFISLSACSETSAFESGKRSLLTAQLGGFSVGYFEANVPFLSQKVLYSAISCCAYSYSYRREAIWVYEVFEKILSIHASEEPYESTYWGKTIPLSSLW
jgi:hypothetical protein